MDVVACGVERAGQHARAGDMRERDRLGDKEDAASPGTAIVYVAATEETGSGCQGDRVW